MTPVLNKRSTQRFSYYFCPRVADPANLPARNKRLGKWFLTLALVSLCWLPLERWTQSKVLAEGERAKTQVLAGIHRRASMINHLHQLIQMYETELSAKSERRLATVIHDSAREYDLDPYLVMAIIRTESFFYNGAVSIAGAQGLMQIMPFVGEELAGELGIPYRPDETLFEPMTNVRMGTYFFRYLLDLFRGDLKMALISYNRGHNGVIRALKFGHEIPTGYADRVLKDYRYFLQKREVHLAQVGTRTGKAHEKSLATRASFEGLQKLTWASAVENP